MNGDFSQISLPCKLYSVVLIERDIETKRVEKKIGKIV